MDPRLHNDIHSLSTEDLCVVWAMLRQLMDSARLMGNRAAEREFSARLRAVDRELAVRQLDLDDELKDLRARNARRDPA